MADSGLVCELVNEDGFESIPDPARAGARCQTCDYWERLDGTRDAPAADAADATQRSALKRSRLLAGRALAGAYGMLAWRPVSGERAAVGWAQFGPISAYPRAQSIRERYPELPDSPPPWVVTCLQVVPGEPDRQAAAAQLLDAVCGELDRRGITAVEAYPEAIGDPWAPPAGPASVYLDAGFERVAGDDRYPVMRRELAAAGDVQWGDLLERTRAPEDTGEAWPWRVPSGPTEEDLFRPPPARPSRPNPFGDDD